MDMWNLLEYAAWALSALLLGWMLLDFSKVNRDFGEDILTSSREGELEAVSEEHKIS